MLPSESEMTRRVSGDWGSDVEAVGNNAGHKEEDQEGKGGWFLYFAFTALLDIAVL